jgi:hypothetical protein
MEVIERIHHSLDGTGAVGPGTEHDLRHVLSVARRKRHGDQEERCREQRTRAHQTTPHLDVFDERFSLSVLSKVETS